MGIIIDIEGLDGCGKETQSNILSERLTALGIKNKVVHFPNYSSATGQYITAYLKGRYTVPEGAIFPLYSLDRYFSYIQDWKNLYDDGYVIICDRYIFSNLIYQLAMLKVTPNGEKYNKFKDMILNYECNVLGLPFPNITFFLTCYREVCKKNLLNRYNGDESKMDKYETNLYLQGMCNNIAKGLYKDSESFKLVTCSDNSVMIDKDIICDNLEYYVLKTLKEENRSNGIIQNRINELFNMKFRLVM